MLPSPSTRSVGFFFAAASLVFTIHFKAQAQTLQESPGVVMVKTQAWSKPSESTPMEFSAYVDRTAGGQAGYYEFKTKIDKRQIPATRVAKLIVYPDPKSYADISTAAEREKVVAAIAELKAAAADFPSTKTYVDPSLKALNAELAQYDAGQLKVKGQWVSKDAFYSEQIANLAKQLRTDIGQAPSAQQFDLAADPRFVSLQEIGQSSPSAAKVVAEITDLHDKRVRAEQRKALVEQLSSPTIGLTEAEGAAARLEGLKPEEEAQVALFLKKWQSGRDTVDAVNNAAQPLATAIETQMSGIKTVDAPPVLDEYISQKVIELNGKVAPFLASKPVPVLVAAARVPVSVCKTADGLKKLGPLFVEKQFLQAQDVLDPILSSGRDLGPETVRVLGELQKLAASRTEQFTKLREEAKLLQSAGKQADALSKYESAYAILADKTIADQIASLKKTMPTP